MAEQAFVGALRLDVQHLGVGLILNFSGCNQDGGQQRPSREATIRLPDALVVHMFDGVLQPGDQMVTGKLHDSAVWSFVWHETGAPTAAVDQARKAGIQTAQMPGHTEVPG